MTDSHLSLNTSSGVTDHVIYTDLSIIDPPHVFSFIPTLVLLPPAIVYEELAESHRLQVLIDGS